MSDDDLTRIYNRANGIAQGEHVPITTARIFAAMRAAMTSADERADYAWRNTHTIEKARMEEMTKRDKLVAALKECLAAYSASPKRPPELVEDWEKCLVRIDKANRQARAIIAEVTHG